MRATTLAPCPIVLLVVLIAVLIGLAAAPPAPAQSVPSDTFFVFLVPTAFRNGEVFRISADARILNTLATLPWAFTPRGAAMAADNQSVRVVGYVSSLTPAAFVLEISPVGQITTIYLGTGMRKPYHTFMDDDGSWVVVDETTTGTQFCRLTGSGLTPLGFLPGLTVHGVAHDPERNRLICRAGTQTTPFVGGYYRVNHRSGRFTTLTIVPTNSFPAVRGAATMPYEPATGSIIDANVPYGGTLGMWRMHQQTGLRPLSSLNFGAIPMDLTRASQRTPGFSYYLLAQALVGGHPNALFHVGKEGTLQTSYVNRSAWWYSSSLLREGDRNLRWTLDQPPNRRSLHLSFPGEGGRPYLAAVSATGVRPCTPLPDGRVVGIVPDALTLACLKGGLPGLITGATGTLDTAGRAVVRFNGNPLGQAARGFRLWAAVLVLDPQAPSGVAWVTDPTTVTLK